MAPSSPQRPHRPVSGRLARAPHLLAAAVGALVLIQLVALGLPQADARLASLDRLRTPTRPTRTATAPRPTLTPTPSPRPSATPEPTPSPTATEEPTLAPTDLPNDRPFPTHALQDPTPFPVATRTPVPPLETPEVVTPTVSPTLTPTPEPVEVLERIEIQNGSLGAGWIQVRYEPDSLGAESITVRGGDGYDYRATFGFLSRDEALAATQQHWDYAGRGGAKWSMIVQLSQPAPAGACPGGALVCYEQSTNSGQAVLTSRVIMQREVWRWLLDDYLNGGVDETTRNGHYAGIQKAVFEPIGPLLPEVPCLGVMFTRVE